MKSLNFLNDFGWRNCRDDAFWRCIDLIVILFFFFSSSSFYDAVKIFYYSHAFARLSSSRAWRNEILFECNVMGNFQCTCMWKLWNFHFFFFFLHCSVVWFCGEIQRCFLFYRLCIVMSQLCAWFLHWRIYEWLYILDLEYE